MKLYPCPLDESEPRFPITIEHSKKYAQLGIEVLLSEDSVNLSAEELLSYQEFGTTVLLTKQEALREADIVLCVGRPAEDDIKKMKKGAWLLAMLDPFFHRKLLHVAKNAGIHAVSMELIPRTTLAQKMDVLSSQANLAGYAAVVKAAESLGKILPMMMTPAGTISPAKVFVIGVGVAGLQAIATAKRLGARVEAFDTRPVVEEQVKSLGAKFVKIDLGELGQTDQGYAKELTPEQIEKQRQGQAKICEQSDIVITTAKLFGRPAPKIILPDVVSRMKPGSIIVDLAAETGGNVVWSDDEAEMEDVRDVILTKNGVKILRYSKFEHLVHHDATQVFASNFYHFIEHFWNMENKHIDCRLDDEILKGCLLVKDGEILDMRFI